MEEAELKDGKAFSAIEKEAILSAIEQAIIND